MITIVNGSPRELHEAATLTDLLRELSVDGAGIAVAVNDAVIARSQYAERRLHEGDRIEVIHAVAGG